MESTSLFSRPLTVMATAEARDTTRSKEHLGTKFGVGLMIVLGGLGLSGCAGHSVANSPSETPSTSPTPTETVPAYGNDLTPDDLSEIQNNCPDLRGLAGFWDNVTKIPNDKAALVMQAVGDNGCDLAGDVVSDWMKQQTNGN